MLACALVVVPLVLVLVAKRPLWSINDDYTMASILSKGLPHGMFTVFTNVSMGALVAALYEVLPACPWWAIAQIAIVVLADLVLCQRLLAWLRDRRRLALACLVILQLACFGYLVVNMQFTVTAGFASAVGLLLVAFDRASRQDRVLGGILLVVGYAVRPDAASIALGMLAVIAAVRVLQIWREPGMTLGLVLADGRVRPLLMCLAVVVVAVGCIAALHAVAYGLAGLDGYLAFNDARSAYTDFPHVSYAQNPAVYESVGWDADLAELANRFYCMDQSITRESFEAITNVPCELPPVTPARSGLLLMAVLCPTATLCAFFRADACRRAVLVAASAFAALCFVLLFALGRLPIRVMLVVTFAHLAACAVCLLAPARRPSATSRVFDVMLLGVVAAALGLFLWRIWAPAAQAADAQSARMVLDAHDDAKAHPDDVFIADALLESSRIYALDNGEYDARNIVFWGGWEYGSPSYERELQTLGIADNRALALLEDNCYLVSAGSLETPPQSSLRARLEKLGGCEVEVSVVREYPSGVSVYQYRRVLE